MNVMEAKKAGVAAFESGRGRAPALNQEFTKEIFSPENKKDALKLMDGYTHGWTIASLAKDAPLPDMPSVLELQEINAYEGPAAAPAPRKPAKQHSPGM